MPYAAALWLRRLARVARAALEASRDERADAPSDRAGGIAACAAAGAAGDAPLDRDGAAGDAPSDRKLFSHHALKRCLSQASGGRARS